MCKPASFVVTKDDVLWLPGKNSHEAIIEANGLKDNSACPNFVRVEIIPPEKDSRPQYNAPLSEWEYQTDQDYLPKWYVEKVEEERVRKVLPEWYKSHIEGQVTDADYISQTAGDFSTQTAGDFSTQTAGNGSTQTAGERSTQTAGERSTQTAGERSTQTAGNFSTQTAGNGSAQTAGNDSTQTAGIGTVQIGRWYDGEWMVATRVITKKEANKPYLFKDGKWRLVKKGEKE